MRWIKKEREAIESQIKEYEKKIGNTRYKRLCIFCLRFSEDCDDCPNHKINVILNIDEDKGTCGSNRVYFIKKFHLPKSKRLRDFNANMQQLKFRKKMWEDSLDLTKREFVKKYKREG